MSQTQTSGSDALAERVDRMIRLGRVGAARPLVAALRRLGLRQSRLDLLESKLELREGHAGAALARLDRAILNDRDVPDLWKCRAEARLQLDRLTEAAGDAAEAVILDQADAGAKALLGVILIELGRYDEARACLAEAVANDPAHPTYRICLAESLVRLDRVAEAEATLEQAVALHPERADLRTKSILLRMRHRDFRGAITLASAAKLDGAADACVFGLLGHAYSSLMQHELAADSYREALKLCPEDSYVRHLVAAAGTMPGALRAPRDYLRAVFNGYAERFESHLITLLYRVPGLIRNIIAGELGAARLDTPAMLDLGCGTGLVGVTCSDLKLGPITGVDISPAMLTQANAKAVYHELIEADLPQFLDQDERRWQLVTAGDVFCYFGDLTAIFTQSRQRMAPGGLFVFSVEELLPDADGMFQGGGNHALGRLGRYAHSIEHVRQAAAAAGFKVEQLRREDLRQESDTPGAGLIAVLRAPYNA